MINEKLNLGEEGNRFYHIYLQSVIEDSTTSTFWFGREFNVVERPYASLYSYFYTLCSQ